MSLKKRILINKFLLPFILLLVLIVYIIKGGLYMFYESYGHYIYFFSLWLVVSVIYIYNSTNHLIKYTNDEEIIKLTVHKSLTNIQEIIIPLNSIKTTDLQTRNLKFGFDVLKLKYVDNEGLYDTLDLRISEKKDWITILSLIEK